MHDIDNAMRVLTTLSNLGVELSLDDFGTGYSSLYYLKKFPIDTIKIDRTFVQDIHTDSNDRAIVEAIILLSDKLGMKVIAEGIEKEEHVEFLLSHGCRAGQGYYFSQPLCAKEFENFLRQRLLSDTKM